MKTVAMRVAAGVAVWMLTTAPTIVVSQMAPEPGQGQDEHGGGGSATWAMETAPLHEMQEMMQRMAGVLKGGTLSADQMHRMGDVLERMSDMMGEMQRMMPGPQARGERPVHDRMVPMMVNRMRELQGDLRDLESRSPSASPAPAAPRDW
jgi:hypothetical protein